MFHTFIYKQLLEKRCNQVPLASKAHQLNQTSILKLCRILRLIKTRKVGKKEEDGDELCQSSSSKELNNDKYGDGDQTNVICYKYEICNDEFRSVKRLHFRRRNHLQYTLWHNPKQKKKIIDQEVVVDIGEAIFMVQGLEIVKTSLVIEDLPKLCI